MTYSVRNEMLNVAGIELSAICGEPAEPPRATVLALPGGGYNAAYWHHPRLQAASLVALGAMLGFRTYSLDRPGYGASAAFFPQGCKPERQIDLLSELTAGLADGGGAGVFLVGHSMGAILALQVAATRPPGLLGIDVSGVPLRYSERLATAVSANLGGDESHSSARSAAELFYGPVGSYDPELLQRDGSQVPPPPIELAGRFPGRASFRQSQQPWMCRFA